MIFLVLFISSCKRDENKHITTNNSINNPVEEVYNNVTAEQRVQIETKLNKLAKSQSYVVSVFVEKAGKYNDVILTGFFVDSRGYLITAAHGDFQEARRITVRFADGKKFPARLVGQVQTSDYCVLSIDRPVPLPVASFVSMANFMGLQKRGTLPSNKDSKSGFTEKLFVVCLCTNRDDSLKLGRVYVGTVEKWVVDSPVVQLTQLQQNMHGCSGAPVINQDQQVVGMIRSYIGDIVFAIDADELRVGSKVIINGDNKK